MERENVWINELLLYFRDEFKQELDDEEKYEKFRSYAIKEQIIDIDEFDKENNEKNFKYIFENYIIQSKTKEIVLILNSIHSPLQTRICNLSKDLLVERQKEVKRLFENRTTTSGFQFSFQAKRNFNLNIQNDYLLDENDFIHRGLFEKNKILFRGDAGIGKTYHAMKILYKWAYDKTFLQDYILLYVNLANVKDNCQYSDIIYDQNFSKESWVKKCLINFYLSDKCDENPKRIILLLDDTDKFSIENSKFSHLFQNINENNMKIIIWSRKWKFISHLQTFDLIFDIQKINNNQLFHYFNQETNSIELWNFLQNDTDLLEICKNPFFLQLMNKIWNNNEIINKKLSFYSEAVEELFKKQNLLIDSSIKENYIRDCSIMALNSLISDNPIPINNIIEESMYLWGLLTILKDPIKMKDKNQVDFLHVSFKEYLIAQYIIDIFQQKNEVELLKKSLQNYKNCFLLKNTFQFIKEMNIHVFLQLEKSFSNISLVMEIDERIFNIIREKSTNVVALKNVKIIPTIWPIVVNICKNISIIDFTDVEIDFSDFIQSGLNIKDTLKVLKVNGCFNGENDGNILETLINTFEQLEILILINIQLETTDLNDVNIKLEKLMELTIQDCQINEIENEEFLLCPNLISINIINNPITLETLKILLEILEMSYNLERLNVSNCNLSIYSDCNFEKFIKCHKQLTEIDLSGNFFCKQYEIDILEEFNNSRESQLKSFKMNNCKVIFQSQLLIEFLRCNRNIEILELYGNTIVENCNFHLIQQLFLDENIKVLKLPKIQLENYNTFLSDKDKELLEKFDRKINLTTLGFERECDNNELMIFALKMLIISSANLREICTEEEIFNGERLTPFVQSILSYQLPMKEGKDSFSEENLPSQHRQVSEDPKDLYGF
ncbi:DgyrCDS14513 [Dimorphilus gyrociliatus]|uniref:DgyrCDS14513 n=1 Tax=Dimorphilus gyrociliatus TaxID=2664684 RepID=A0A7I8WDV6_9ANNE|nr:DgyrCDS14513 [Dimorphilus gyrociliatus]